MRRYAWYCLELDAIVLQSIMEDCIISFEWGNADFYFAALYYGPERDLMDMFTFQPLGEV